jgi:outer membrane immunogenic protein
VPVCAQFGGFYVGVHGSAESLDWKWYDRDSWAANEVDNSLPHDTGRNRTGWGAGVQAGWNWQRGCAVWGFEADWTWSRLRTETFNTDGDPGTALDTLRVANDLRWHGTVRTRSGVVVSDLLLYVTGGLAYARFERQADLTDFIGGRFITETFTSDKTKWGWTVGVGAEWALWNNFSIKSEVLYAQYRWDEESFNSIFARNNGNPPTKRFEYDDSVWSARIGLNWRWGGGPIVARY